MLHTLASKGNELLEYKYIRNVSVFLLYVKQQTNTSEKQIDSHHEQSAYKVYTAFTILVT